MLDHICIGMIIQLVLRIYFVCFCLFSRAHWLQKIVMFTSNLCMFVRSYLYMIREGGDRFGISRIYSVVMYQLVLCMYDVLRALARLECTCYLYWKYIILSSDLALCILLSRDRTFPHSSRLIMALPTVFRF